MMKNNVFDKSGLKKKLIQCFDLLQLGRIEVNLFNNGVIETVDINRFNAPKSIDKVNSNAF